MVSSSSAAHRCSRACCGRLWDGRLALCALGVRLSRARGPGRVAQGGAGGVLGGGRAWFGFGVVLVCNVVSMLPCSRGDSVSRQMTQNPHHFHTRVVFAGAAPRRPCHDGWDARNAPAAKNSRLISGIGGPLVCPPSLPKFTAVVGASAREICSGSLKLIRERVPAVN